MDFTEATDRLTACPTHETVAEAVGRSVQSIRVARMRTESANYRPPPDGWESAIAKLARARAAELVELAEELES